MKLRRHLSILMTALVCCAAAQAEGWTATRSLEGPFAASSPPSAPLVAVNAQGHALFAWNATGVVRFAERVKGSAWTASKPVPGGGTGAGPVALAIGDNEVAAITFTTVATRYDPQHLKVSVRLPGAAFGEAVEPVPGAAAGDMRLGVACNGTVTLVWVNGTGVWVSELPGTPGPGACDGVPGSGPWSPARLLSNAQVGAALPELAHNAAGHAVVVWQEGAPGSPSAVFASARVAGGTWLPPERVSAPTAAATWNPKPAVDAAGNAAVAYLDGTSMVVTMRPVGGSWSPPVVVSDHQAAYYPALAMSGAGDLLAAWLTLDSATGAGAVWQSAAASGQAWSTPTRLSTRSETTDWPTAAFAADGSVTVVAWTDDATNTSRAAVRQAGTWTKRSLGAGWWGSQVPVAAGGGVAAAGWPQPVNGNPNSARLVARSWQ
jgi:hypothetical protein